MFEYGKFLGGEYEHFSKGRAVAVMRAGVGDVLVVPGHGTRTGLIIDVLGKNGAPPYVVKWLSDGHIAMVTPGQYARIIPASDEALTEQPSPDDQ
jgi:hypothetical protein